jgi:ankyrin repeat protein
MSEQKWTWAKIAFRLAAVALVIGLLKWCNQGGEALRDVSSTRAEVLSALAFHGIPHQQNETPEQIFEHLSDSEKSLLLYESIESTSLSTIKWMVSHGADPKNVGIIKDLDLLQLAARSVNASKLAYFADMGFKTDVKTSDGQTLLHIAAKKNMDKPVLSLLLQWGLSINDTDQSGQTPLHGATYASTRLLLESGAQIDVADQRGRTPLHQAVMDSRTEVANELISRGASVFAADKDGRTPLHFAAIKKSEPMVNALLAAGAMKSARDVNNMTPRDLAQKSEESYAYPTLLNKL